MKACCVDECENVPDKGNRMCTAHRQRMAKYGTTDLPPRELGDCQACGASMAHLPVTPRLRQYCGDACRMVAKRAAAKDEGWGGDPRKLSDALDGVLELRAGWRRVEEALRGLRQGVEGLR
jgi:hypothetical protein